MSRREHFDSGHGMPEHNVQFPMDVYHGTSTRAARNIIRGGFHERSFVTPNEDYASDYADEAVNNEIPNHADEFNTENPYDFSDIQNYGDSDDEEHALNLGSIVKSSFHPKNPFYEEEGQESASGPGPEHDAHITLNDGKFIHAEVMKPSVLNPTQYKTRGYSSSWRSLND